MTERTPINLSHDEIADITGAVRPSTQLARLHSMGFHVLKRPDGRPLVARAHYLAVMGVREEQSKATAEPDFEALR